MQDRTKDRKFDIFSACMKSSIYHVERDPENVIKEVGLASFILNWFILYYGLFRISMRSKRNMK